jgi:hypothetical protein
MEAARRLDEWRVLSKKIPSVELVPQFVILENREGQINLNTSEWLILSKIDGQRSIKQIAQASGLSVFDAAKILYGLIATGLIRLKDASGQSQVPASTARVTTTPVRAAAAPVAPQAPPSGELLAKLNKVRDACNAILGAVGESVVNKHYLKAKGELEKGAGVEAVEEAVHQIARAASILKGPGATEQVSEQLKGLR